VAELGIGSIALAHPRSASARNIDREDMRAIS
jgi:hypothetical protein